MNIRLLLPAAIIAMGLAGCGAVPAVATTEQTPLAVAPTAALMRTVAPEPTTASATAAPAPTAATGTNEPANQLSLTLDGTIGDQAVRMYLHRDGTQLRGQYFFQSTRVTTTTDQPIYVTGVISPDNRLALEEYDDAGMALFQAALQATANNGVQIAGTWASATEDRTLPLTLTTSQPTTSAYSISASATREQDAAKKATYNAVVPQIGGSTPAASAFNALVTSLATKQIESFKADMATITDTAQLPPEAQENAVEITYDVIYADDNLISVLFNEYTNLAGAAHPNTGSYAVNYDLKNNRELALADLFAANSPYLQTLSTYSLAKIRARDPNPFEEGATPTSENYHSWTVDPQGLQITFDPYQVLPYAFGPQVVFVPWSELKAAIDPRGPAASIANH